MVSFPSLADEQVRIALTDRCWIVVGVAILSLAELGGRGQRSALVPHTMSRGRLVSLVARTSTHSRNSGSLSPRDASAVVSSRQKTRKTASKGVALVRKLDIIVNALECEKRGEGEKEAGSFKKLFGQEKFEKETSETGERVQIVFQRLTTAPILELCSCRGPRPCFAIGRSSTS